MYVVFNESCMSADVYMINFVNCIMQSVKYVTSICYCIIKTLNLFFTKMFNERSATTETWMT